MREIRGNAVRQSAMVSVVLMGVLFLMPLVVVTPFQTEPFYGEPLQREVIREIPPVQEADGLDRGITLRVLEGETVRTMTLDQYLLGVLRAEMPAEFEPEALKAQTVAARTYTRYRMSRGGAHGDTADLCTSPACCQAYLEQERAWENWGAGAEAYEKKLAKAVADTDGEVILYGGEPILAVFHSSSSGWTRGAETVWQESLPYLQAVASPEAEAAIPNYYSRATVSVEEFRQWVKDALPEADLSGAPQSWLSRAVTDDAGNVETVDVGGITVKGSRLRSILGLRSACFSWDIQGGEFIFFVTGYGHGVGMSQYGANRMAAEGADYRTILTHYYTGVVIEKWGESFAISPDL